jgi:hypothetical protein
VTTVASGAAMSLDGFIADPSGEFDKTRGWGGRHPMGAPVFVLTHQPPDAWPFPEALEAGLLDEVWVSLVPVLLGDGIRYFGDLD